MKPVKESHNFAKEKLAYVDILKLWYGVTVRRILISREGATGATKKIHLCDLCAFA